MLSTVGCSTAKPGNHFRATVVSCSFFSGRCKSATSPLMTQGGSRYWLYSAGYGYWITGVGFASYQ